MNAHTEHPATLARVIADDQRCQCTGHCVNGTKPCTCGLEMPIPTGWAASSAAEANGRTRRAGVVRCMDEVLRW